MSIHQPYELNRRIRDEQDRLDRLNNAMLMNPSRSLGALIDAQERKVRALNQQHPDWLSRPSDEESDTARSRCKRFRHDEHCDHD